MEEKNGTCPTCGCGAAEENAPAEAAECTTTGTCDVNFEVHEDAKFATLLALVPMLTLSAFNMMGLL